MTDIKNDMTQPWTDTIKSIWDTAHFEQTEPNVETKPKQLKLQTTDQQEGNSERSLIFVFNDNDTLVSLNS